MDKQISYWFVMLKLFALALILALAFVLDQWTARQAAQSLVAEGPQGVGQTRFIAGVTLGSALLGLTWFIVLYNKTSRGVGWFYLITGLALNALPLLSFPPSGPFLGWVESLSAGDLFIYTATYIPFVGLFSLLVKEPTGPGRHQR